MGPTQGLCLGSYGGPRGGGAVSSERGNPVACLWTAVRGADLPVTKFYNFGHNSSVESTWIRPLFNQG